MAASLLFFLIFSGRKLEETTINFIQEPSSSLFSRLSHLSSLSGKLKDIKNLIKENLALREENIKLLAKLSAYVELEEDNLFLREVLKLPPRVTKQSIDSNVFGLNFTPEGHTLLLNKGLKDTVSEEDVVISGSGVLIGQVAEVFNSYSRILVITDPDFKIMVRTAARQISAMARGGLDDGVYLDFVYQNNEIAEEDLIITSGNDLFPAGLVVGRVKSLGPNDGNLFKKIRVEPMFRQINLDKVLILKN